MKDMGSMMRQAQAMQAKLQEAQARHAESTAEGQAGNGLVKVVLSGAGELKSVTIADAMMEPGEGETLADLIVAAHADAKKQLDEASAAMMRQTLGPLAGAMGGLPGMKF